MENWIRCSLFSELYIRLVHGKNRIFNLNMKLNVDGNFEGSRE